MGLNDADNFDDVGVFELFEDLYLVVKGSQFLGILEVAFGKYLCGKYLAIF